MPETDVIIIGAGMAGLTAAAYLARAGRKVEIFEQHSVPGGYISSFTRQGFCFPAGPTSFGSNGMVFPILKELGLESDIRFVPVRHQLSWNHTDIPFHHPRQVRQALVDAFPKERQGLKHFFHWVETGGRGFRDLLKSGLMLNNGRGTAWKVFRLVLKNPLYPWAAARARNQTNLSLYARYFKDTRLLKMLGQLGYPVMDGMATLGMWAAYFYDYYVPLSGMQAFSDVLVRFIQAHGGKLHLGQRVDKILLSDGAAAGVRLASGEERQARWIVSACDLRRTFLELIDGSSQVLSPRLLEKIESGAPSESIFSVFLGLSGGQQISTRLQRFTASHVWFHCCSGDFIVLVLLSADDPSLAPPGKHALWIGQYSPYSHWENLSGQLYRQCKETKTHELIRKAEEFIPGLSQHIEVVESASPLTYERYTGNWRGATAGWSWDPAANPQINFSTDVDLQNFFCVGHWLHTPAGVPAAMGTAWYIVREILKKESEIDK